MGDYPLHVFVAVLASALAHAAWNAFVRGGRDPLLHTAAIVFWAAVAAVPFLLAAPLPDAASLPYLAGSNLVHMAYYLTLAAAYRRGALSLTYPLIRGTAPLLIALAGLVLFGEMPGTGGALGIFLVSLGVLALALRRGQPDAASAVGWALLCAATIAAYSLLDGLGARASHSVAGYGALMFVMEGVLFLGGIAFFGRGRALATYVRTHWRSSLAGGVLSAGAYTVSLWAMTQAPIALVAATRETSVLFAAVIGVIFLGERLRHHQWAGAVAIVAGAILLRG